MASDRLLHAVREDDHLKRAKNEDHLAEQVVAHERATVARRQIAEFAQTRYREVEPAMSSARRVRPGPRLDSTMCVERRRVKL